MTAPAHLPADQQAVLDLVLRRGRSYAGIARALRLDVDAVRARARDAVTTLSAPAPTVPDDRRAQVTDWLLGQAEPAAAERAQAYLIANPGARDWARTAADSLGGTASARLAALPVAPEQRAPRRPLPPIAGLIGVAVPALAVFGVAIVVGNSNEPPPIATTPSVAPAPSAWLAPARPGSKADGAAEVERRGDRAVARRDRRWPAAQHSDRRLHRLADQRRPQGRHVRRDAAHRRQRPCRRPRPAEGRPAGATARCSSRASAAPARRPAPGWSSCAAR